eukprot:m.13378 g.13378  ORF g.13378 m.13378 type:complete len:732 (-) comp7254_c0_seq1:87-2282(-)
MSSSPNSSVLSTASFNYDDITCPEFSFSTKDAVDIDMFDQYFSMHRDSVAVPEMQDEPLVTDEEENASVLNTSNELDITVKGHISANTSLGNLTTESVIQHLDDDKENQQDNMQSSTPAEKEKPRLGNLKKSWSTSGEDVKTNEASATRTKLLQSLATKQVKPQRKPKTECVQPAENVVQEALKKSKKSKNMTPFVPLRSNKSCTVMQEVPESLTKVPEHKFYEGYTSMAEGLVKFFTEIPERFLPSASKSAKKSQPASINRTQKTTEELQLEELQREKAKFKAMREEFLSKHQDILVTTPGALKSHEKRTPVMDDPYALDPTLPYDEAVAKQAEMLRKKAEADRQARNQEVAASLKKVLESTEGEMGISRKEVKQPTEPNTPEFVRRALMNKRRKEMLLSNEQLESDLLDKAQRQFKARNAPAFVKRSKQKKPKRVQHAFVGARKVKSTRSEKPAPAKKQHKLKLTAPEPFDRPTLYQNPKQKHEQLREELTKQEEAELQEKRVFKAHPFKVAEPPSIARPQRRIQPEPFSRETLYQDPRPKIEELAKRLAEEQTPTPFKARGMPVFEEFQVERPHTMVVPEPFNLESVRRAEEHKQRMEEARLQAEREEEAKRKKNKAPLSELTNNPNLDPHNALLRKEQSIQLAKEKMEADRSAKEEQEKLQQEKIEQERKEYRQMLNKISFRREMPIFSSPKALRSEAPLVDPSTPDVMRPLALRHNKPTLPAYLRD